MTEQMFLRWREVVTSEFSEIGARIIAWLPNVLGALMLALAGWVVAKVAGGIARRTLRGLGLDRVGARHRIGERAGLEMRLSDAAARLVFYAVMLVFALAAVHTLGVTAVTSMVDHFLAYIPNLVGAALTALFGILLARFVGSLTTSAALASGMPTGARIGFIVQLTGVAFVAIVALEQLGFATNVLVLPLTAVLAAAGFAIGLSLALGARPIVTHILAGHFLKRSLPRDTFIEVDGERGVVERVGAIDTLLRNGDRRWSVPNAHLLERVIMR